MLSRDAILAYQDDNIGKVEVPELGEVGIACLTVAEMDRLAKLDGSHPASVEVTILGACDDKGVRLFSDKDRLALGKLPASVVAAISKAVLEHNGLGAKADETAKND